MPLNCINQLLRGIKFQSNQLQSTTITKTWQGQMVRMLMLADSDALFVECPAVRHENTTCCFVVGNYIPLLL